MQLTHKCSTLTERMSTSVDKTFKTFNGTDITIKIQIKHSNKAHARTKNLLATRLWQQLCLTLWRPLLSHGYRAIKHPMSHWVKPSFVIFDIRALWRSALSVRVPGCQKLKLWHYNWWLNLVWHRMLYSCTHMTTVGVNGLINGLSISVAGLSIWNVLWYLTACVILTSVDSFKQLNKTHLITKLVHQSHEY